jgi:hypothetical protein
MCASRRAAKQPYIASMGIYVVKADVMNDLLLNRFVDVRLALACPRICVVPPDWHASAT